MEARLYEKLSAILDKPPRRYKPLWAVIVFWVGVGLLVGSVSAYLCLTGADAAIAGCGSWWAGGLG